MTSRRKVKRASWVETRPNWWVREHDGTLTPFMMPRRWYDRDRDRRLHRRWAGEVEPMTGCVKRTIQNKRGRGGSWNGATVDPWYGKGLILWRRDSE